MEITRGATAKRCRDSQLLSKPFPDQEDAKAHGPNAACREATVALQVPLQDLSWPRQA